jgi:competence protein ComEC
VTSAAESRSALADLRLVPVAIAAWAGSWLGTWATAVSIGVGVAGALAIGVAALLRRSALLAAIAAVLFASSGTGALQAHRLATGPIAGLVRSEAVVVAEVVTTADPRVHPAAGVRPPFVTIPASLTAVSGRGLAWQAHLPILVSVSGGDVDAWRREPVGTRWRLHGRLQPADRGSDLVGILRVRGPAGSAAAVLAPPSIGLVWVERVRAGLREAVRHRAAEPRALVPALVLGDTSAITPALEADFRTVGLTHLTAVSGANLTVLLGFMLITARWAGLRGWWLRIVGLVGVLAFVALCRSEPSVLRAAAMGLVVLAALGMGGRRSGLRHLALAVMLLVLIDPYLSRSLGFALSVLASAGIIIWSRPWIQTLNRWLPLVVAESVAVPLAAQLSTLPLIAAISGRVSVVGLLANAAAGPLVAPATVLGFAAAGLSLVSALLAGVAGFGAAWSAQMIIWIARLAAALPGASWQWPASPVALGLLAGLTVLGGMLTGYALARPAIALVLVAVLIGCVGVVPTQPGWPPRGWVLVACDVGQGDGLVLSLGDRRAVVVDAGPDPDKMLRCLDQLEVSEVPLLILTHFHADHVDGLAGVFARRRVAEIWISPLASPDYEAAAVQRLAADNRVPVRTAAVGSQGSVGAASLVVIGPSAGRPVTEDSESATQNDSSLVIMVSIRGLRLLLTGDVEPPGQGAILADGADLQADVLKIPHHGSARQDEAFFAATHARIAIASAGQHNDYGHPAPRTVALARSLGMTVLRTDTEGSVAVVERGGVLSAVTQRPG